MTKGKDVIFAKLFKKLKKRNSLITLSTYHNIDKLWWGGGERGGYEIGREDEGFGGPLSSSRLHVRIK